ncbi:S1 family peptidase [Shewanella surugensis]|uniref:Serine protease n=1 Tax=Shewanella surugensis TaxID=212020 RepID=A0ABT0L6A3_9GAMM|nr:serine protease [Shewanella surugensis]MCL1123213.1 serine protease [Shewanella surugensis]
MKPYSFFLLAGLLLKGVSGHAEFDPDRLSLSTVRVQIKNDGAVVAVATGFVWKQPSQIVTSLHVMHSSPSSQIIIEFGKKRRKATIKALLIEADLVLLEVKRPIEEWVPLLDFDGQKPPYKTWVTALGYHRGALGMSTRELVKGYAKPEVLLQLLPSQAVEILRKTNMPSVTLPIYYLDGSLLPGYSGSPIVNPEGQLIGIGDGGLENGAANVSWVIPARYLTQLEQSPLSQLPVNMRQNTALFSLDRIEPNRRERDHVTSSFYDYLDAISLDPRDVFMASAYAETATLLPLFVFKQVDYQQFRFIKVKTRRFADMIASSGTPKQLTHVLTIFERFFPGVKIAYNEQRFDVYTDAHYGLNIVVPTGVDLVTNDAGFLLAQGQGFCRTCAYEIQYHARLLSDKSQAFIAKNPDAFLHRVADQHWDELNQEGDYDEYSDLRQIEKSGSYRYVLRALFSDFAEPFKDKFELNYYSAAISRNAWFQAQGILSPFDTAFMDRVQAHPALDCRNDESLTAEQISLCSDVLMIFNVLTSTHLTSFSNRIFNN